MELLSYFFSGLERLLFLLQVLLRAADVTNIKNTSHVVILCSMVAPQISPICMLFTSVKTSCSPFKRSEICLAKSPASTLEYEMKIFTFRQNDMRLYVFKFFEESNILVS